MNDDRVFQLLAEINPVPDPDGLDSPIALTDTEEMRGAMATIKETKHEQTHAAPSEGTSRKRGLVVAAAAAALVLIVGVGAWVLAATNEGELAASPEALASVYLDAKNDNHPEAALGVLSPTASLVNEVPRIESLEDVGPTFDWLSRRGIQHDYSCTETSGDEVVCTYEYEDRLSRAVGHPPVVGSYTFLIMEGQITRIVHDFDFEDYSPNVFEVFVAWLDAEHPGAFETIYQLEGGPLLTPEALDLTEGYVDEFEASRS